MTTPQRRIKFGIWLTVGLVVMVFGAPALATTATRAIARSAASAIVAKSPVIAVETIWGYKGYDGHSCNAMSNSGWSTCPVTKRLWKRVNRFNSYEAHFVAGTYAWVCRCQSYSPKVIFRVVRRMPGRLLVHVNGAPPWPPYPLTFVVIRRDGGWLVANQFCAGRPQTTIYARNFGGVCPAHGR
jgi:hypothetical protein